MWLRIDNPPTRSIRVPGMSKAVDVPDSGLINVSAADGEALLSLELDAVTEHVPESDPSDDEADPADE